MQSKNNKENDTIIKWNEQYHKLNSGKENDGDLSFFREYKHANLLSLLLNQYISNWLILEQVLVIAARKNKLVVNQDVLALHSEITSKDNKIGNYIISMLTSKLPLNQIYETLLHLIDDQNNLQEQIINSYYITTEDWLDAIAVIQLQTENLILGRLDIELAHELDSLRALQQSQNKEMDQELPIMNQFQMPTPNDNYGCESITLKDNVLQENLDLDPFNYEPQDY